MIYEIEDLNERAFRFLAANGLVASAADYSRRFLGRSRTYLNMLRRTQRDPSHESWVTLIQRLDTLLDQPLHQPTRDEIIRIQAEIQARLAVRS